MAPNYLNSNYKKRFLTTKVTKQHERNQEKTVRVFSVFRGKNIWYTVWDFKKSVLLVLAIKNDLVRLFADLAEMNKIAYFAEHSHFGAIGRLGGKDHFFSPAQYLEASVEKKSNSCSVDSRAAYHRITS